MPLTRFRVRSEFGLADPELYRAADKDDPEALLEGVAMAGLVGVLRQLGDLAEFAAEIFHDLHEEVMATATRGHGLVVRVQQLEAEFPPIEKALLSQTSQSSVYYNTGVDWHPNLHSEQNLIARGDLPRFVMDSYEESRGPPRLFLLDKFDVAGAGACLKRYTDPSFFKAEASASGIENVEIPREKRNRRVKKKGLRGRNGETTPEVIPASHSKLQQLFLVERIENGYSDPSRLVKLKKRHLNGSPIESRTGKSYMEKFVESQERELACETSIVPVSFAPEYSTESGIRMLDIGTVSPADKSPRSETAFSSPSVHEVVSKPSTNSYNDEVGNVEFIKVPATSRNDETSERSSSIQELQVEKQLTIYGEGKPKGIVNGYESDDVTSEVDNYMDALASIESEIETDNEYRSNRTRNLLKTENNGTDSEANEEHLERRSQLSDTHSVGNFSSSDDGNNSFKRDRSSFSYSDSPSSLVENTPVDSEQGAKILHSTEVCGSEMVNESSNELSITVESNGVLPHELVVSSNKCIEEETSCSRVVTDLHSDHSACSSSDSPVGPETGGSLTNLVDTTVSAPLDSSQINEDFTNASKSYPVDESEAEVPNVVAENERRNSSENEGCQIRDEINVLDKNLAGDDNYLPSIIQKQIGSSSLPDVESSSSNSILLNSLPASSDHWLHQVDDSGTAVGVNREDSSLSLDAEKIPVSEKVARGNSMQIPGSQDRHFQDFSDDVPQAEPVSEEEHGGEDSGTGELLEKIPSPSLENADEDYAVSRELQSSYLSGPSGVGHQNLDSVIPEADDKAICSKDIADTVHKVHNGINLSSDPLNSLEPLVGTVVLHQNEAEFLKEDNAAGDANPGTFREVHGLEFDSLYPGLSTSISASYNHSNTTLCDNIDEPLPAAKALNSFSIVGGTETSSLDPIDQELKSESSYHFHDKDDHRPSAASHLPDPEEARMLPADQVGAECPAIDEVSPRPEFPSEQSENMDSSDKLIAYQNDGSLESYQEDLPSHSSIPEFSFKSPGQEVDNINQVSNPFESPIPGIVLLPEAPQVNLAEMPPLPPLPPMQWRMGFGMGMGEGNRGLFSPILQPRADEEVEFKFPASQSISQQHQNPFSPPIKQDEASLQVTEPKIFNDASSQFNLVLSSPGTSSEIYEGSHPHVEGETVQSASSFFSSEQAAQLSATQNHAEPAEVMVLPPNDINSQHNPVLSSPEICSETHGNGHLAVAEETLLSDSSSFSSSLTAQSTSAQSNDASNTANQPPNQPVPEAGDDETTQKQSVQSPEEKEAPFVTSMPPPAADEQVRLGLLMPVGETSWLSNKSKTSTTSNGEENGILVPKIPRPRNPLIDAVNAHGTSKLRKVTDRIRPQIGPKAEERDSLLEQIRTKSFSLKPTTATRPSMAAFNKTNLKVHAILAKANAIRQSCAGSDDEDEDNWE